MKFAEVPIDSELINEMFDKTPVGTHIKEIREDFENYHASMEIEKDKNKITDLQFYKTELFRSYCMGLLSVLTKESKFNQKVISEISRQNNTTT